MNTLCQHTLIEFHGCDVAALKTCARLRRWMVEAVRLGRGTIVRCVFHRFNPWGVSGVILIAESHVTIHTWPEHHYAAVDIFSCSDRLDHAAIRKHLGTVLGAARVTTKTFARGRLPARRKD